MNGGVQGITKALADYLTEQGATAVPAWNTGARQKLSGPTAVVSLRGGRVAPVGFQDYLGQRQREDGVWEDWYGREATLTFGLDLCAPEGTEDGAFQALLDQLSAALLAGAPEGLAVEEFSWGELTFDTQQRLLRQSAQAVCRAYLCAAEQADGLFTDFELRGGIKA